MLASTLFPVTARVIDLDFNHVNPVQLARALRQEQALATMPICVRVDCQSLWCLRTHGVSHFVSQLLTIRQSGVEVRLYNVGPVLRRMLALLRLEDIFCPSSQAAGWPVVAAPTPLA
jgi:anti-anti-sigma regulatory factor